MQAFCEWLEATGFSHALQSTSWLIPVIQTIHLLSIAAVVAAMGMLGLRLLGVGWRQLSVKEVGRRYLPWMWRALPVLALTGALMIIAEPARSLPNAAFQLKMLMLLSVVGLSLALQRSVAQPGATALVQGGLAKAAGLTILILWLAIVVAGRWIAYL